MSKRRKKKKDEVHISESWLLPYADILTLLLALFIVLFSMSSVDAQKFQRLSQVFNGIFVGGTGVSEYNDLLPPDNSQASVGKNENDGEKEEKEVQFAKHEQEELEHIQMKINAYMIQKNLEGKFDISLTQEGLLLTIRDNVLFESGVADVRKEDLTTAKEISELLVMDIPREIIISGHTDNVPIKNARFQSNWELSVMRAVNFMKIILENDALDPGLFSAKGFGEFQPIATNDNAEGKAKNRRVEVLILPQTEMSNQ
ncbi:flagellar motor protein MotB [Bacillus chungangensis]|uniref:Chemotaxis protein MotB n=1 Tax=Bacillus chungangensis TaxID=587633 RepID=A0ABT9WR42_9BACI|nr:flagellar motor protein MotB [Bacillus chungangensis]MDQ0175636.1 chemotaxis protein MotB [Bacillus chungangensis]